MKAGRIDVQKQKDDGTGTGVMRGLLAGGRMSPAAKTIAVTILAMLAGARRSFCLRP